MHMIFFGRSDVCSIENYICLIDIFHLQPALINKIGGALRAPPIFAGPLVNEIYRSNKYNFRSNKNRIDQKISCSIEQWLFEQWFFFRTMTFWTMTFLSNNDFSSNDFSFEQWLFEQWLFFRTMTFRAMTFRTMTLGKAKTWIFLRFFKVWSQKHRFSLGFFKG